MFRFQFPVFDLESSRKTYCFAYTWVSNRKTCTKRGIEVHDEENFVKHFLNAMILINDASCRMKHQHNQQNYSLSLNEVN